MELRTALTILLAAPVSVVVVFCGLAFTAWMVQMIGLSISKTRRWEAVDGGVLARVSWWQMQRRLWGQAKAKGASAVVRRLVRIAAGVLSAGFVGFSMSY